MISDTNVLMRLTRLLFRRDLQLRRQLAFGGLREALAVAASVLAPFLLKRVIDGLGRGAGPGFSLTILAFVGAWSISSLFGGLKILQSALIVERVATTLSHEVIRQQLPRFAENPSESQAVFSALERLPQSLQILIDGLLWRLTPLVIQILASVFALAWLTPRFAVAIALILITYGLLAVRGARTSRHRAETARRAASHRARHLGDILAHSDRVVFNGALSHELDRFESFSRRCRAASAALAHSFATTMSWQFAVLLIGVGWVLVEAGREVAAGTLSLGVFVLLQAFAFRLTGPLTAAGALTQEITHASANLRAVFEYLRSPSWPTPTPRADRRSVNTGVAVKAISFRYPEAREGLTAISTTLAPRALVALVGPNGAGKSTLAKILGGVLIPDQGTVEVDGVVLHATPADRRISKALYVPQTVTLLDRSALDNGLYPPSNLNAEGLRQRLKTLQFHAKDSRAAFDLTLQESARHLSGGQTQKLELARLTGVNVPLLVIDELTASLDRSSARRAVSLLRRTSPATILLVTHDLALAETADQVLFLSNGALLEDGPHKALLARSAPYRQFWI